MFPFYEETGSEKVTHCFKDSVAETENANIRIPKQMIILREGYITHRGSSGQGETTAALGLRGVFMEKVSHEAGP